MSFFSSDSQNTAFLDDKTEKTRIDPILIDNQIRDGSFIINIANMRHMCDMIRSIIQITKEKMEC